MARYAALGMVARWKPVHLGHAAVLRGLVDAAPRVVLGIGSANRYDARSPFTATETRDMIRLVVAKRPASKSTTCPISATGRAGARWSRS